MNRSIRTTLLTALLGLAASAATAQQGPAAVPATAAAAMATTSDAQTGLAAYYSNRLAGRRTASGKRYNPQAMTAAHQSLPFGTRVKVTHGKTNRSVVVTINDRGPTQPGRILDLSRAAATQLRMLKSGLAEVKLEVLSRP